MIPAAVQWHEGMLLLPQHFQQAFQRSQALLSYMSLSAAPYGWGVRRLTIDQAALAGGLFSVTGLEAVMPDGLLVLHSAETDAPPLQLKMPTDPPAAGAETLAVHLTVAVQSLLAARTGEAQRFRSVEGPEVADENTGDNPTPIPRLVPLLGLYCTDGPRRPPPSRYVALPLAVFRWSGAAYGRIEYEPPRLRAEPDTLLHGIAAGIARDLRMKARQWEGRLRRELFRGQADAEGQRTATLSALLRGLPRLDALRTSQVTHPFDLYQALCDIAGDLSVIGARVMAPEFAPYAHVDPLAAYAAIRDFVAAALRELRTPNRFITFAHPAPGRFEVLLEPGSTAEPLVLGARLGPGQDPALVSTWFNAAMIGAVSRIAVMRSNRVPGAERVAIASAPELDLVPPPDMLLFRVPADPAYVAAGEALQVSRPPEDGPGEPAELQLFLPDPAPADPAPADVPGPTAPG